MTLQSISVTTPNGQFHIIIDGEGVARASGFGTLDTLAKRLPAELQGINIEKTESHPYEKKVLAYFNGDAQALNAIPRKQTGSDFQGKVWQAISDIPYGKTISYKQLADASGNPKAFRAAGTICGLNKLILLVPCHRVLKSDGGIGNYLYGTEIKQSLLQKESVLL